MINLLTFIIIFVSSSIFTNAHASGPFTFQVAQAVPFDNATNGFTSEEVQSAIEEAKNTAPGKARATIASLHNGTLSNGFWIGYTDLINSFDSPFVLAWGATLKEVTFSNNNLSVDGAIDFYKNGTAAGQIIHNEVFTNVDKVKTFNVDHHFIAGDLLRLRWTDTGTNPKDMGLMMFFILD